MANKKDIKFKSINELRSKFFPKDKQDNKYKKKEYNYGR